MSVLADARVLRQFLRGAPRGVSHAERLQRFYAPQAGVYDEFRERLLHGRRELIEWLAPPPGSTLIDLGGGTGRNLEFLGSRMLSLARVEVVDLCPALLDQARLRCARWPEVALAVQADATEYRPAQPADCVIFSYSLSMIPDWRRALANALSMLRPGGVLGVVDFYVSRRDPPAGFARHGRFTRAFWPRWFGHDGVRLDAEPMHELFALTQPLHFAERTGAAPYLPGLRVPYYLFVGRKKAR
jgi:S-adenosylmethionine-diacylgycerolhomoserine-N-methlytransferase